MSGLGEINVTLLFKNVGQYIYSETDEETIQRQKSIIQSIYENEIFHLPQEDTYFSLFFRLKDPDSKEATFFSEDFIDRFDFLNYRTYESLKNLAEKFSEISDTPVLMVYEHNPQEQGEGFNIPLLQLYERGSIYQISEAVGGSMKYSSNWEDEFFRRESELADRNLESHIKQFDAAATRAIERRKGESDFVRRYENNLPTYMKVLGHGKKS